jgi:EAL domain-containing protein (putative c-di-GMP-specific phosphodiesterase class I)
MIAMTHALGMKVIAECIENKVTLTALQELGCDYMQGYYLGKPMPAFEFQELIRSDRQVPEADEIIMLD